jgi:hypothetical protein
VMSNYCITPTQQFFSYIMARTINKGNKSKLIIISTDKISQQPENCENRNDRGHSGKLIIWKQYMCIIRKHEFYSYEP